MDRGRLARIGMTEGPFDSSRIKTEFGIAFAPFVTPSLNKEHGHTVRVSDKGQVAWRNGFPVCSQLFVQALSVDAPLSLTPTETSPQPSRVGPPQGRSTRTRVRLSQLPFPRMKDWWRRPISRRMAMAKRLNLLGFVLVSSGSGTCEAVSTSQALGLRICPSSQSIGRRILSRSFFWKTASCRVERERIES